MVYADYTAHTHELFIQLKLHKLEDIYFIETAKFMYKYYNNALPNSFSNLFDYNNMIHSMNTRRSNDIRPYHARTNILLDSILCKGPSIWNSIKTEIKDKNNIKNFSLHLKNFLSSKYEL